MRSRAASMPSSLMSHGYAHIEACSALIVPPVNGLRVLPVPGLEVGEEPGHAIDDGCEQFLTAFGGGQFRVAQGSVGSDLREVPRGGHGSPTEQVVAQVPVA